jgi:hypothetical protein
MKWRREIEGATFAGRVTSTVGVEAGVIVSGRRIFVALVLLTLVTLGLIRFSPLTVEAGVTWSGPIPIEIFSGHAQSPSVLQAKDGLLWLAWADDRYANVSLGFTRYDILYKVLISAGVWGATQNITGTGMNLSPSVTQLSNGTIAIFWASNPTGTSCSPACNLYERYITSVGAWSPPVRLSSGNFNDSSTSTVITRDGSLWLFWTREIATCIGTSCTVTRQIYYRTLKGNAWSPETPLTTDTNWNFASSELVGKDGVLRVVYSKGAPSQNFFQLYSRSYDGITWSPEVHIVTSTNPDIRSSQVQDRNGTLWIFYQEAVPLSPLLDQQVIWYVYSTNNGQNWSAPAQLTHDSTTIPIDDLMPFAIQTTDKSIWVYYISNLTNNGKYFDIYALQSSAIAPIHDVDLSSITASPGPGSSWTITVKVQNPGDFNETVNVSLILYDSTVYSFGPAQSFVLAAGATSIVFSWNTGSIPTGLYRARATVAPVPGESLPNQVDNALRTGVLIQVVTVTPPTGPVGGHVSFHV